MCKPALHRNGVERFGHRFGAPDHDNAVLPAHLLGDRRGRRKDSGARAAECFQQGTVIEFADDTRTNALFVESSK